MTKKTLPPSIKYTSRDFESIKRDLVDHAKRYYSNTFKDFSDTSFGSLMLDSVAYVGDVLSFYLDYQANELFLDTANEYDNIVKIGHQLGYKFNEFPMAHGLVALYLKIPSNSNGIGPDVTYLPVLKKGTQFSSAGGGAYVLNEDIDFTSSDLEVVVAETDSTTGVPTYYAVKAYGQVISGILAQENLIVGDFQKFLKIRLSSPNISEIVSVFDSEGHEYYEVDNLSQNLIFVSVNNKSSDRNTVPNILKPMIVARRFTTQQQFGRTYLQFGYGSDSEVLVESVSDPSNVVLNVHGKDYISDTSFDPSKLIATDKFGVAPTNTTLTVYYRTNTSDTVNASVGAINSVTQTIFEFDDATSLNRATQLAVQSSLEVTNEERITGDSSPPAPRELKEKIKSFYAAQKRAVTREDYKALVYSMPSKFGSVKRCTILQDNDSFKRNLNLYLITEDQGALTTTSTTLKENIKTWISSHKMVNDTIDMFDAKIVNVGINFALKADNNVNKYDVLRAAIARLVKRYGSNNIMEIGEAFSISEVYKILNSTVGVTDTLDVEMKLKISSSYADTNYRLEDWISPDGTVLYVPEDHIFEIKYPADDIKGVVK